MAYDGNSANVLNPLLLWTDLGMRAAEMTVASSQNMSEAVDRLARAGASVDTPQAMSVPSSAAGPGTALPLGFSGMGNLQRTVLELMTQSWVQWMSAMGSLFSMGAGIGLARKVARQDNPLEAVRASLRPAGWGEKPAARRQVGSLAYAGQPGWRSGGLEGAQRATASAGSKPRRAAAAKSKSSRRAARK